VRKGWNSDLRKEISQKQRYFIHFMREREREGKNETSDNTEKQNAQKENAQYLSSHLQPRSTASSRSGKWPRLPSKRWLVGM